MHNYSREQGACKHHRPRHRSELVNWMQFGAFIFAVLGTWIGVKFRIRPSENPLFFTGRTEMNGYRYQAVPIGKKAAKALAATGLLNGHFFDSRSNRVSVFKADWKAGQGHGDEVLGHTPELCWVGNGFRMLQLGQPSQVFVNLNQRLVPFQCRILTHPGLPTPEITLWAACIDGRWDDFSLGPAVDIEKPGTTVGSYLADIEFMVSKRWAAMRRMALQPFGDSAPKQFIRLSMPVAHEWPSALANLERFAQAWVVPETQK
jgi:hypothetical protein